MAYYSCYTGRSSKPFRVYGPGGLIAGEAETEELALRWCEILTGREAEIWAALEMEDYARAERIWAEVEQEARRPAAAV
jgi:hypothetical protein